MKNAVFIATSLDGFIADPDGGVHWLETVPNPEGDDVGYLAFTAGIDALVMGRHSFETVLGFGVDWPYAMPVFVLSETMTSVPEGFADKVQLLSGPPEAILAKIHSQGHHNLWIDGGRTIQSFLRAGLIDELVITTIPVLLGGGIPLFGGLPEPLELELVKSEVYLGALVQRHYRRKG
ncbi:dihydrofolate reductase family protein [Neolewinella lacunae]|uniref:Dihydrofolate reductase n=1 Tax=Neolewinella lacunae TaxID=1517758 RepID=A0A923T8L6_9BACT|nr:dihydrofolate reductase family protein [Neolewinella lacunae]MBC6995755.1 dihydrofolate reductase [Neolewinella lacunae]MDN3636552.1 dihydrofolate reductase family protein [Neolewinella lacunae]